MTIRNVYTLFAAILLCVLCLGACGQTPPISSPVKIIAFGDSLTAGYQLPINESVPAKLQERFMAEGHSGVHIINMGISGDTTQDGLSRLNLVLEAKPDIVILELGANDILRQVHVDKTQQNLEIMIQQMQAQNIKVIFCGVEIPNLYVIGNKHMGDYQPMFDALADKYELEYYPNFLSGVQGKSAMNLQDGLHPNGNGTQEIANLLYPVLLDAARKIAVQKH